MEGWYASLEAHIFRPTSPPNEKSIPSSVNGEAMRAFKLLPAIVCSLGIAFCTGCGAGLPDPGGAPDTGGTPDTDGTTTPTIDQVAVDIEMSPDSRLIAVLEAQDGRKTAYYGTKDEAGLPTSIESILVTEASGAVSEVIFDDQMRPACLIADSGDSYSFNWVSDTEVEITAATPDGEVQVTESFDPTTGLEAAAESSDALGATSHHIAIPENSLEKRSLADATATIYVDVFKGGVPYDPVLPGHIPQPAVTVWAQSADTEYNGEYAARRISTGVYRTDIHWKSLTPTLDQLKAVLAKFAENANIGCDFLDANPHMASGLGATACASIGLAVAAIPGVQVTAPAVTATCGGTWAAYSAYCDAMDAAQVGQGLLDFLAARIRNVLGPPKVAGTVQLRPYVRVYHEHGNYVTLATGSLVIANVNAEGIISAPSALRVDLENDAVGPPRPGKDSGTIGETPPARPTISLQTNPRRPVVGQPYTVTADFFNVPTNGRVQLTIMGRDNKPVASANASWEQIGIDGRHQLSLSRTLGQAHNHYAIAQVADGNYQIVASSNKSY